MFTGLVEGRGLVKSLCPEETGVTLAISPPVRTSDSLTSTSPSSGSSSESSFTTASLQPVQIGESIAINGCCLTVVSLQDDLWHFQAGTETLSRTNLGALNVGDPVNIERSLPANARLGGHFVQGHIDGTGVVKEIEEEGEWVKMWFSVSKVLSQYMVSKGSVAVDGISLTLVDVFPDRFSVALIPHTLEVTTLGIRNVGQSVNIETDILGKYVHNYLQLQSGKEL